MADVQLKALSKSYGANQVVQDITLHVREGEFVSLLGPSGCGKTTLLRMIAGFIEPTAGEILIGGNRIEHMPPYQRDIGMVFQSYALFPHMTVAQNIEFGLKMRKAPQATIRQRVAEALELVKLSGLEARLPRELSGGQQQRVAVARALAIRPQVLLLDEPLSNLDAKLRVETRVELRRIQRETNITTIFVTHDQEEALIVSDRIAVMHGGVIEQLGEPNEIYERPVTHFVAGFIGRTNFFKGRIQAGTFISQSGIEFPVQAADRDEAIASIRPERIQLAPEPPAGMISFPVTIKSRIYMGSNEEILVDYNHETLSVILPNQGEASANLREGMNGYAGFSPEDCRII